MGAPQYEQAGADIGGTGTTDTIPRWTGASTLGDSGLIDNGTSIYTSTRRVGVDTSTTLANVKLQVGSASALSNYQGAPFGVILPAGSGSWLEFAENSTNGTAFRITKDSNTGVILNANGKDVGFDAGAYESLISGCQMVLKTSGNVGIGTASPAARVNVDGNAVYNNTATQAFRVSNGSTRVVDIGYDSSLEKAFIQPVQLGTAYRDLLLAPNGGNVGIGTASPDAKLAIPFDASNAGIRLRWVTNPKLTFMNAESYYFRSLTDAEQVIIDGPNKHLNVSQSTWGLKLPATPGNADTQTLDCYQELTWTPELRFGGASTGITYSVRQGYYTRVGNLVTVQCYFVLSSKGTATGAATIEGLPATVSASSGAFSGAAIGWIQNITYTSFPAFHANVGTTSIILWNPASGGAGAQLTDAQFAATSGVIFTMTYRV